MEIVYIPLIVIFLSTSIIFLVFLFRYSKKIKLLNKESQDKDNLILKKEKIIKDKSSIIYDLKNTLSTNRTGYYDNTISLIEDDGKSSKSYVARIYVKELEKYKNGESKIELDNIEVISGFDINQYSWVKRSVNDRFCSIKKSDQIEWLEIEEDLKEMRKEKLKKILS